MNHNEPNTSNKSIDLEIKQIEVEIAKLHLEIAEKERKKELLQEQRGKNSLGIDKYEHSVHVGDKVKLHTPSNTGPFKGETHAIVVGRSKRHSRRILIGKIGNTQVTTNRELHNVSVVQE